MKNRNCPNKDMCWDYNASRCEGCAVGEKIALFARQNKKLKAENAALRERLEKAVELPCELGNTTVYAIECYSCGYCMREYCAAEIAVTEDGEFAFYSPEIPARRLIFGKDVFTTKEAAEARLKELQEGRDD